MVNTAFSLLSPPIHLLSISPLIFSLLIRLLGSPDSRLCLVLAGEQSFAFGMIMYEKQ
jgi:hypothetical protein